MKHHSFSRSSESKLSNVHPDLIRVIRKALLYSDVDFGITSGVRSAAEQLKLLEQGKTTTTNSRHVPSNNESGYSEAVDVLAWPTPDKHSWAWVYYERIAKAVFKAAIEEGVQVEWGGFWRTFKDGVHFQLGREGYPRASS